MEGGTDSKEEEEEKKKEEDRQNRDVSCNMDQTEMEKYVGKQQQLLSAFCCSVP